MTLPSPRLVTALAAAGSLTVALASAQQRPLDEVELTCPVDGTVFRAVRSLSTNTLGGTDSDFCQYASGGQPREHGIAVCPTCLYAAPVDRFERELTDAQKAALLQALSEARNPSVTAVDLQPWERYQMAALCAGVLGETRFHRGDLLLTGAWTVRDRIVGFIPAIDGPLDVLDGLEQMDAAWLEIPDLRTQQMALFDLARAAHRGGFADRRDAYLARLDELQPVPEELLEGRERWMREPIDLENRFLTKAIEHYAAGLEAGEGSPREKATYRYLIIDLRRRLGHDPDELQQDINLLLTDEAISEEVRIAARTLSEVFKRQEKNR